MATPDLPADSPDLAHVPGNDGAKRALEVAIAGGHHLLLVGPAGGGKTGLVRSLPGLLPPLTDEEAREVSALYRRAGEPRFERTLPPIRSPHPASTERGFLGSGRRPGELDLAHRGVLVLDPLPDFRRGLLHALRQPLEEGVLRIAGPGPRGERPAAVALFATMRSCPCGGLYAHEKGCACTPGRRLRYRRSAWEPLGFLFDLQSELGFGGSSTETSATVRERILEARRIARERLGDGRANPVNAAMTAEDLRHFCPLDRAGQALQEAAFERLGLTPGVFARVLRVARTLADLAGTETIRPAHLAEALGYRSLLLPGNLP